MDRAFNSSIGLPSGTEPAVCAGDLPDPASGKAGTAPLILALIAAALTGCALPVFDGKYDYRDGWREGLVEKIGSAQDLGGRLSNDCRFKLPEEARVGTQFAVLEILGGFTRHQHHVVPLDPRDHVRIGDRFLTNILGCGVPLRFKGQ